MSHEKTNGTLRGRHSDFKFIETEFIINLNESTNFNEVRDCLVNYMSLEYKLLDSELLMYDDDNSFDFQVLSLAEDTKSLHSRIHYLIEEGIIDWVMQSAEPQLIMDLQSQLKYTSLNILLLPILSQNKHTAIFISFTELNKEEFTKSDNRKLKILTELVSNKLSNLKRDQELENLKIKLDSSNERFIQSLKSATFGELSLTVLKEVALPIQIIDSNIGFIENGAGNINRRLEIIRQQTKSISEIVKLFDEIFENSSKTDPEVIELNDLIEEVKNITSSQLKSKGLIVEFESDADELYVRSYKSHIEYVIVQIFKFFLAADSDVERIFISLSVPSKRIVSISVSYDYSIVDTNSFDRIIDEMRLLPAFSNLAPNFSSIKNVLSNSGGKIECNSKLSNGTIFRIIFPLFEVVKPTL